MGAGLGATAFLVGFGGRGRGGGGGGGGVGATPISPVPVITRFSPEPGRKTQAVKRDGTVYDSRARGVHHGHPSREQRATGILGDLDLIGVE